MCKIFFNRGGKHSCDTGTGGKDMDLIWKESVLQHGVGREDKGDPYMKPRADFGARRRIRSGLTGHSC